MFGFVIRKDLSLMLDVRFRHCIAPATNLFAYGFVIQIAHRFVGFYRTVIVFTRPILERRSELNKLI